MREGWGGEAVEHPQPLIWGDKLGGPKVPVLGGRCGTPTESSLKLLRAVQVLRVPGKGCVRRQNGMMGYFVDLFSCNYKNKIKLGYISK